MNRTLYLLAKIVCQELKLIHWIFNCENANKFSPACSSGSNSTFKWTVAIAVIRIVLVRIYFDGFDIIWGKKDYKTQDDRKILKNHWMNWKWLDLISTQLKRIVTKHIPFPS